MAGAEQLGTLPGHGRVFRRRFCRGQPQHWNSDTHRPQKTSLWYCLPIGLATSCMHPRRDPDSAADSGKRKWGPVTHPCHYFRLPGPVPRKEPGPLVPLGGVKSHSFSMTRKEIPTSPSLQVYTQPDWAKSQEVSPDQGQNAFRHSQPGCHLPWVTGQVRQPCPLPTAGVQTIFMNQGWKTVLCFIASRVHC